MYIQQEVVETRPDLSITPVGLSNSRIMTELKIEWDNGETSCISHARLRQACRCAICRRNTLVGLAAANDDIRLLTFYSMGYGLQLVFDDGHDRGVYPWKYLQKLSADWYP